MKISIVTVTLNNKAGLLRAIESVRSQTYKNVEHIIVDGGSTDGTVEMLREEVEKIGSYEDRKISPPINRGRNDKEDNVSSRIPKGVRDLEISPSSRNDKEDNMSSRIPESVRDLKISPPINRGRNDKEDNVSSRIQESVRDLEISPSSRNDKEDNMSSRIPEGMRDLEISPSSRNDKEDNMSSRIPESVRDLKISPPINRGRNDKKDNVSSRIQESVRDLEISPPINRGRNDEDQGDKSLLTTHYSLLTISEADTGIYDAINKGIKLATGDVIGLLHSDDFYADEFVLERYAEAFTQSDRSKAHSDFQNPKPTTNHLPPTTHNQQSTIDAVYSDLVYVSRKSDIGVKKTDADKEKAKKQKTATSPLHPMSDALYTIPYSIIRYWKAHNTANSKRSLLNGKRTLRQAQDDNVLSADNYQLGTKNNELTTTPYPLPTINQLLSGWMPPHPTLFLRREVFEKYGLYRTDMKIAADYEMILRLFYKHKITAHYLPLTTYCMTIGGASNKSLKNIFIKSSEDYRAMKLHSFRLPIYSLILKNLRKISQFF